jgi:hypothetical protein
MKREDIEKVAKDYSIGKTYFRRNVLKEVDADDYVLRKGNCSEDFIAGAEWRISSVWHDTSEKPDKGKMLIVEDIDGAYDLVYLTKSKPWEELSEKNHYTRWAYVEDLLPNMED